MPYHSSAEHENHMKGKKAQGYEGFGRTMLAAVGAIAFLVVLVQSGAANALFFNDENTESLNTLAKELDQKGDGYGPLLLPLDEDMALVGFSPDAVQFTCVNCFKTITIGLEMGLQTPYVSSFLKKPQTRACADSSCLCLCKDISSASLDSPEMTCGTFACKKISATIFEKPLVGLTTPSSAENKQMSWEGGFLFGKGDGVRNGLPEVPSKSRVAVSLERKRIGSISYASACPKYPCIPSQQN